MAIIYYTFTIQDSFDANYRETKIKAFPTLLKILYHKEISVNHEKIFPFLIFDHKSQNNRKQISRNQSLTFTLIKIILIMLLQQPRKCFEIPLYIFITNHLKLCHYGNHGNALKFNYFYIFITNYLKLCHYHQSPW